MSGPEYELARRRLLQATGAGIVGTIGLSTVTGASRSRSIDTAPEEDEYEDILVEMDGDGSDDDPYIITDVVELQAVSGDVTASYELGNDIDASATADWNDGAGFDPIFPVQADDGDVEDPDDGDIEDPGDGDVGDPDDGELEEDEDADEATAFVGTLEGNDYEIRGLTVDRPEEPGAGLVLINQGILVNFSLTDATVAGSIAGLVTASNSGGIGQVSADGTVTGEDDTGGFLGINAGQVVSCEVDATVTSTDNIGGFVGTNIAFISDSDAAGEVSGSAKVGGFAGQNSGEIDNAHATCTVTGNRTVGGFVGDLTETITASTATGDVTGESSIGGFAGENWGELLGVTAEGAVDGEERVGGIAGESYGDIRVSSAHGPVEGVNNVGGIVGNSRDGSLITDSYAISAVDGESAVGALAGLLGREFMSERGTVELQRAYWSVDDTDHDPVGAIEEGDGEVTVEAETIAGIDRDQFVGEDAPEYLTEFDFVNQWRALPDDVPVPRAQTPSVFEILDVNTTEIEVEEGETVDVEVDIENVSDWEGTQTVGLSIEGEVVGTQDETLEPGESTQVVFGGVPPEQTAAGTYSFTVQTRDDSVEGTIEVEGTSTGNGGDDDDDSTPPGNGDDDADDDGPGFGVAGAVTGVGASAYLLARRLDRESTPDE